MNSSSLLFAYFSVFSSSLWNQIIYRLVRKIGGNNNIVNISVFQVRYTFFNFLSSLLLADKKFLLLKEKYYDHKWKLYIIHNSNFNDMIQEERNKMLLS